MFKEYLELPDVNNSYYNYNKRYELHPDIYFVFGSNLAGRHGRGAAKEALTEYGAIYGIGTGFQGFSYAIPTKDTKLRTLDIKLIKDHVDYLKSISLTGRYKFFITAIGTGLAGYEHSVIAPMFKGIKNSWLPDIWKPYIETL